MDAEDQMSIACSGSADIAIRIQSLWSIARYALASGPQAKQLLFISASIATVHAGISDTGSKEANFLTAQSGNIAPWHYWAKSPPG